SATNRQGILLSYTNHELRIENHKPGAYDLVDLGIAKRLFEIATQKGTFEDGDHALFQITE
ncbi:MAG: nitroreductase, partial [Candidatus Izemoplasmatales bacterium]